MVIVELNLFTIFRNFSHLSLNNVYRQQTIALGTFLNIDYKKWGKRMVVFKLSFKS